MVSSLSLWTRLPLIARHQAAMMSSPCVSFLSPPVALSTPLPSRRFVPRLLFLCQCIVGSRPQLPAGPPCVRAPIGKPRHTTWPCTRVCTHKYRGGKEGEGVHPPLRAPGRDSCRGMQIYRKRISMQCRRLRYLFRRNKSGHWFWK